jgi:16S rRNA A1518/A1519 N6-dimethyltransferase RsmA/KsgA/DIM1 with predicted DNA glycosylase/AP lyase activity
MIKELINFNKNKIEYGDYQTPKDLSNEIITFLKNNGCNPASIIEPTCGIGNFVFSSLEGFSDIKVMLCVDINRDYIEELANRLELHPLKDNISIKCDDFFSLEWAKRIQDLPEPVLIIGNPPWITNSELGSMVSNNLPKKVNFHNHNGLDAITGKSNFDISEWMIIRLLEYIKRKNAMIAMLCKTTVARKILKYAWKNNYCLSKASLYMINAQRHFNVTVDACLFVCSTQNESKANVATVFSRLDNASRISSIGIKKGHLISDIDKYMKWEFLDGKCIYQWRSGLKHDCAKIMELKKINNEFVNGLGEYINIEETFLYPLLKSSDISKIAETAINRWVIVPQKEIGGKTSIDREKTPNVWRYLMKHSDKLDGRKSSIYNNMGRFSIFGIGKYAFSLWKVAISGLYKKLHFKVIPPFDNKPVMLDDTCYFISCNSKEEAILISEMLNSSPSKEFFESFIFWDSKRPITKEILQRIDLMELSKFLKKEDILTGYIDDTINSDMWPKQLALL